MVDLPLEIYTNIVTAATSGALTLQSVKILRSINRTFCDSVASTLLNGPGGHCQGYFASILRSEPGKEKQIRIQDLCAQWLVLVCSGILNSAAKAQMELQSDLDDNKDGWTAWKEWKTQRAANYTWHKWTTSTKMLVYAHIYQCTFHGEVAAYMHRGSDTTTKKTEKIDFVNGLSCVLMELCKNKSFNPDEMRKMVELVFKKSRSTKGVA